MKYPIVSRDSVLRLVSLPSKARHTEVEGVVEWRGDGEECDNTPIAELRSRLSKLIKKHGGSPTKGSKATMQLEADAAVAVHDSLKRYDAAAGMDLDFWVYLAIGPLASFVEWRYGFGSDPIPTGGMANFGVGKRSENLLYRLWSRAELVYDDKLKDPYSIVRRGSVDFWRSHVLRQGFCNVRSVARAWVMFQYPDGKKTERLKIAEIRELVKRVGCVRSNVLFEVLDHEQVDELLERECAEIVGR